MLLICLKNILILVQLLEATVKTRLMRLILGKVIFAYNFDAMYNNGHIFSLFPQYFSVYPL